MNIVVVVALVGSGLFIVLGALALALGRSAAIGDRQPLSRAAAEAPSLVDEPGAMTDRNSQPSESRTGPPDRRSAGRPWSSASPGRRAIDALRWEVEEARSVLAAAEARLAIAEAERDVG